MVYKLFVDAETNPKRVQILAWDTRKELEPFTETKFIEVGIYRSIPDLMAGLSPYIHLEEST